MDMRCWTVLAVLSASLTACRAGATGKEGEAGAGGQAGLDGTVAAALGVASDGACGPLFAPLTVDGCGRWGSQATP